MKSQELIPAISSDSQNRKILYSQIIVTIRYSIVMGMATMQGYLLFVAVCAGMLARLDATHSQTVTSRASAKLHLMAKLHIEKMFLLISDELIFNCISRSVKKFFYVFSGMQNSQFLMHCLDVFRFGFFRQCLFVFLVYAYQCVSCLLLFGVWRGTLSCQLASVIFPCSQLASLKHRF